MLFSSSIDRLFKVATLGGLYAVSWLLAAPAQAQTPKTACDQLAGYELENCLAKEIATADEALNAVYKRAQAMIAADKDVTADQRTAWLDNLTKAERAWLAYRDADCLFDLVGAEWNFGSGTTAAQQQCVLALTQARTGELLQRYPAGQ